MIDKLEKLFSRKTKIKKEPEDQGIELSEFKSIEPSELKPIELSELKLIELSKFKFDDEERYKAFNINLTDFSTYTSLFNLSFKKDAIVPEAGDNIFDNLPNELKIIILHYLTVKELCLAATVSKHWNGLTSLNCLWRKFSSGSPLYETMKESYKNTPRIKSFNRYSILNKHVINLANLNEPSIFSNFLPRRNDNIVILDMEPETILGGNESDPSKQFVLLKK
jgi:hypothetical protein